MRDIKFGTDGWRAIIAEDYTVANVCRVAKATADWTNQKGDSPSIVLGYDCRFGGRLFTEAVIKVMIQEGITVHFDENFVSTPMISLAAQKLNTGCGVIITASHNPPSYNGFKIKANYGGPAVQATIEEIEAMIPETYDVPEIDLEGAKESGKLVIHDFENMYWEHVQQFFNMDTLSEGSSQLAYDAMYGAGQGIARKLIPQATLLHADYNPSFMGRAPEPIAKNLPELSELLANTGSLTMGLATDGDADRIGLFDEDGKFVDAHHIILLLIHILHKSKEMNGKVVVAFSVSDKIKKMCDAYGLEVQVTKIGFKYICEIMKDEDVLVGGEESGGIAVKGHIPERDGIWDGLVILEHMAKTGRSLKELIQEVYDVVGAFAYNRNDLRLTNDKKWDIMDKCKEGHFTELGGCKVLDVKNIDGYKFYLEDEQTIMIRPSGTEPVLRVYGEAKDLDTVNALLERTCKQLIDS